MATALMWWAQNWVIGAVPPGIAVSSAPGGLRITGAVDGPPSGFLSLGESSASFGLLSQYWLNPGNIPPGVCLVDSTPRAIISGELLGLTAGGIYPFGPWPTTICELVLTQSVYSSGVLIGEKTRIDPLISLVDRESGFENFPMPSPLPLQSFRFDLPSNPNLTIDTRLLFHIRFRGDGRIAFSQLVTSPAFVIGVPQWDLVSVP